MRSQGHTASAGCISGLLKDLPLTPAANWVTPESARRLRGQATKGDREELVRVLVVEDDPAMRDLLIKVFEHLGLNAVGASGGSEAAAMVVAGNHFDLLLSDIRMNPMDGFALASVAKSLTPPTKVVLFTAYGEPDDERRARAAGADGYMSKPFSLKELLAMVQTLLRCEPPTGEGRS